MVHNSFVILAAACLAFAMVAPIEQDLSFKTKDGLELHGTFVEPEHTRSTKLKAVLLLPGSGPTDRNGNQPPALVTDTLKQIADALAIKGIASFRFDKRAAHINSAIWPKEKEKLDDFFSFEHFVEDAESAVEFLRDQPSIDASHVGMLGHSEGGLITIVVASKLGKDRVSAAALVGTGGRRLDAVLIDQIGDALHRQTDDKAVIDDFMKKLRDAIEQVKTTGTTPTGLPAGLQALFSPGSAKILRSYFTIDPCATVTQYDGPVLLLQGGMDAQVSPDKDFPVLKKALESRTTASLESFVVPNASHNLKHVESSTDPGYDGPVIPEALARIVKWAAGNL
jgi:pimeloyl-ACP methyl ester carboxylesterase